MKKNTPKIIIASTFVIFTLATVFGGSYAWFSLSLSHTTSADQFIVVNMGTCDLYSVDLIKFNYRVETYGSGDQAFTMVDYFNPDRGEVAEYHYRAEDAAFGYYENETWHEVSMPMNKYDPIDKFIYDTPLREVYTNVIYKFTVTSVQFEHVKLNATLLRLTEKSKEDDELFLTTCTDYDIYFQQDLRDDNPKFIQEDDPETPEDEYDAKLYYPSFITDKSQSLSALEKTYHKISYLSSLETTHSHLYGSEDDERLLANAENVQFTYDEELQQNVLVFYVNVNYAPSQLSSKVTDIYQGDIRAVYDFGFRFYFFDQGGE